MEDFRVSATGHSLNYLPEYIAQRHGFFQARGLNVVASVPSPWDLVLDDLADSSADAALGGIWVPSMYRGRSTSYTAFAQVSNRCPLALIQRGCGSKKFDLRDVVGRTVLMKSGNGASVGLFFKMLLREHGVDPNDVHYVQDLDGKMLGTLFQGGMGDFFVVDVITAQIMAKRDPGISVCMRMIVDGGEIPWSVYYCESSRITPAVIDQHTRFCAGLMQAIAWILERDAETFKDTLAQLFPNTPVEILVETTNLYRRNGMWTSAVVSRTGFERWQKGIADGRLIETPLPYSTIVNDVPATAAMLPVVGGEIKKEVVLDSNRILQAEIK